MSRMAGANGPALDDEFMQHIRALEALYGQRLSVAQAEGERWRQLYLAQKEQSESMETELMHARRAAADLEANVKELVRDNQAMAESRNQAVEKYNQLRQAAIQLQNFKQAIAHMVVDTPGGEVGAAAASSAPLPEAVEPRGYSMPMGTPGTEGALPPRGGPSAGSYAAASQLQSSNVYAGRGSRPPPSPSPIAPRSPDRYGGSYQEPTAPIDATAFYKEVKAVLAPADFKAFAANIRLLNTGQQSIEETLENIRPVLTDQSLYATLHSLIRQAVLEAAKAAAEVGVATVMGAGGAR